MLAATKQLQILEGMRKEYRHARLLAIAQSTRKLRYLKGLVLSQNMVQMESSDNSTLLKICLPCRLYRTEKHYLPTSKLMRSCPICQERQAVRRWFICYNRTRTKPWNKSQNKWVMCPTCRQHTDVGNIALADDRQNFTYPSHISRW
ncbi:hypothetical protein GQ457_09G025140 [Hibiscus cannabinus]